MKNSYSQLMKSLKKMKIPQMQLKLSKKKKHSAVLFPLLVGLPLSCVFGAALLFYISRGNRYTLTERQYTGPYSYVVLARIYSQMEEKDLALQTIQTAMDIYSSDKNIKSFLQKEYEKLSQSTSSFDVEEINLSWTDTDPLSFWLLHGE